VWWTNTTKPITTFQSANGTITAKASSSHRHPSDHARGDEHAVPLVLGAARADLLLGGEVELLPPELEEVVEAPARAASVDALQDAAVPRQCIELFLGERRPHLVAALQVVEAVVRHVVADIPEAERRHRRQERDPAEDVVQQPALEERAVAGVMADEEQADDAGGDEHRTQDLDP
jgi:hypothetical protein